MSNPGVSSRGTGIVSLQQLSSRLVLDPKKSPSEAISVMESQLPEWQRQLVWNEAEMGWLMYSILQGFPIGQIILWKKHDGVRVPIDGRQRLTAIKRIFSGDVAIPQLPGIPNEYERRKYILKEGDEERGFKQLELVDKEKIQYYPPSLVQYDDLDEKTAQEIFVRLQGGKSLSKTEIRAAIPGKICDFVSELTKAKPKDIGEDEEEDEEDIEESKGHEFFRMLSSNMPNRRKAHRNMCDVLLHEHLEPGVNKHWTTLEEMYRVRNDTLKDEEKKGFRKELTSFLGDVINEDGNQKRMMPQLKSTFQILSIFRAWSVCKKKYDMPDDFDFAESIRDFEIQRATYPDEVPWVVYTNALSNAGYSQNRCDIRHDILMTHILQSNPSAEPKIRDKRRAFSMDQKIAIWERAKRQCEYVDGDGNRCNEKFPTNPREADADHVVRWVDSGSTSMENARLLCVGHNRSHSSESE